jgi:sirohydrochlorin ferrochelatase
MSKYGQLIKEARKQESQKTRKPESISTGSSEPDVNLSIKVAAARRRHWAAEAKRQGTTLTAAITEALSAKFGEPE